MASPQSLVIWRYLPYYTHGKTSTPAHEQRFLKAHRANNQFCCQTFYRSVQCKRPRPQMAAASTVGDYKVAIGTFVLSFGRSAAYPYNLQQSEKGSVWIETNSTPASPAPQRSRRFPSSLRCTPSCASFPAWARSRRSLPLCGRSSRHLLTATPPKSSATTRSSQSALSSPASCSLRQVPSS